jgi:hypothetical protein
MVLLRSMFYVFVLVFLSRVSIIPLDHFDSNIGNNMWLPMGAVLVSYLLYGWRVLPVIYIAYITAEIFIEGGFYNLESHEYTSRFVNTVIPLLVITIMSKLNINIFSDLAKKHINKLNMGILILVASLSTTMTKHLLLFGPEQIYAGKVYFESYVIGDVIGATIFIVVFFYIKKVLD